MDFNKKEKAILQEALNTYGIDKQLDIAIEEMAELTKAIIKHRRYASRETYENLCEETADVAIMLEQIFLSTKGADIAKYGTAKIERLNQRLTAEKTHFRCAKCGKPITKEEVRTGCRACKEFESKVKQTMTNFEKIKSMSVDEMSNFLMWFVTEALTNPRCIVVKVWLESEVSDNGKENSQQ